MTAQQKCLAHLRRHFQRLIKLSGKNNQAIGKVFIDLIDEAFRSYQLLGQSQDQARYRHWAVKFKAKVELNIKQWLTQAGYEAGKLEPELETQGRPMVVFSGASRSSD